METDAIFWVEVGNPENWSVTKTYPICMKCAEPSKEDEPARISGQFVPTDFTGEKVKCTGCNRVMRRAPFPKHKVGYC